MSMGILLDAQDALRWPEDGALIEGTPTSVGSEWRNALKMMIASKGKGIGLMSMWRKGSGRMRRRGRRQSPRRQRWRNQRRRLISDQPAAAVAAVKTIHPVSSVRERA